MVSLAQTPSIKKSIAIGSFTGFHSSQIWLLLKKGPQKKLKKKTRSISVQVLNKKKKFQERRKKLTITKMFPSLLHPNFGGVLPEKSLHLADVFVDFFKLIFI